MSNNLWTTQRDYQYLFLDMNAYFASCEQQSHPNLRHKPVAVTPVLCPTGCVITSSYEARKFGVKTGIMIKDAKKLCPNIHCIQSNTYLYLEYHQKLIKTIKNITPFFVVKSVDELVIRISPQDQTKNKSLKLAQYIKNQIKMQLGSFLKCSIGIAPNSYLAKTAAEYQKPDGLTLLTKNNIANFLSKLNLTDLCGINHRMQIRLNLLGIQTPMDFFNENVQNLRKKMGIVGEYWYQNLHGYDTLNERCIYIPKTIGQSHVLEPNLRKRDKAWPVCQKLIYKAALRLRNHKLVTKKLFLYINFYEKLKFKQWIKINPTSDSLTLSRYFKKIYNCMPQYCAYPIKITVVFSDLKKNNYHQLSIFDHKNPKNQVSASLDHINLTHPNHQIYPASLLHIKQSAPKRISFGSPDNLQ